MKPEAELDPFERKIIENVREHGCQVNFIFDPDGEEPEFSYSIGFPETLGQPDVIVFGLPQDVMHFMVNQTMRACQGGLKLVDWAAVEGLLEGFTCIARVVGPENIVPEYFNSAMWHFRRRTEQEMTTAIQLFWPGAVDGLFPWDEGCADEVRRLQPPLYERNLDS